MALTSTEISRILQSHNESPVFTIHQSRPSGFPSQGPGIRGGCGERHHELVDCDETQPPLLTQGGDTLGEGKGRLPFEDRERKSAHVGSSPPSDQELLMTANPKRHSTGGDV